MTTRREFMVGGAAALTLAGSGVPSYGANSYFAGTARDQGFTYRRTNFKKIAPKWRRQIVKYFSSEPPGTVVVDTQHHFLYQIVENQTAVRYGVGVGREGFKWYGRAIVKRKALWPRWVPPAEMLKRQPDLPRLVKGGAANNPLGPRALYLYNNGADTGYRFHGTLQPWTIGTDASSGCIRMFPEDVIDLYLRCPIGTAVQVLPHIADQG